MVRMINYSFILYSIICIICLCLCGYIIKRYVFVYPNKLIPIFNVIFSVVMSCVWSLGIEHKLDILFIFFVGTIYGLASVGLHQIIKQTYTHIKMMGLRKSGKKRGRRVSI